MWILRQLLWSTYSVGHCQLFWNTYSVRQLLRNLLCKLLVMKYILCKLIIMEHLLCTSIIMKYMHRKSIIVETQLSMSMNYSVPINNKYI